MLEDKYLVRAPLLDPKQQVMSYKLAWQKNSENSARFSNVDMRELLTLVARPGGNAKLGMFFLDVNPGLLSEELLQAAVPAGAVLMLNRGDLVDPVQMALVLALRQRGFGLALRDGDIAFLQANERLLPAVAYVEVGIDHPDLAEVNSFSRRSESAFSVIVDEFPGWQEFDACALRGLYGFFSNLCLKPRSLGPHAGLSPQARLILQLMQMVRENADVRHLEKILKQDATLSYKLFQYINSASFGLVVEIRSLRHAVAMLGYTPLFRWLSVLLATTNAAGFSPALLQAAIVRARFAELLGQNLLSREESENLFFVGMFSLLDQLLGIPIRTVLNEIVMADAVVQALLSRNGVYGPFLALVEACESEHACAAHFANSLFLTAAHVNQAHVSALSWVKNLKN